LAEFESHPDSSPSRSSLTAVILVSVVGTSGADALALVVLSTVVGLMTGSAVKQALASRATLLVSAE
jgi:hypothetical protein